MVTLQAMTDLEFETYIERLIPDRDAHQDVEGHLQRTRPVEVTQAKVSSPVRPVPR